MNNEGDLENEPETYRELLIWEGEKVGLVSIRSDKNKVLCTLKLLVGLGRVVTGFAVGLSLSRTDSELGVKSGVICTGVS